MGRSNLPRRMIFRVDQLAVFAASAHSMIYVRFLMPSTTNIARSPVVDFGGMSGPLGNGGAGCGEEAVAGILGAVTGVPAGRGLTNKSVCRYVIMAGEVLLELK